MMLMIMKIENNRKVERKEANDFGTRTEEGEMIFREERKKRPERMMRERKRPPTGGFRMYYIFSTRWLWVVTAFYNPPPMPTMPSPLGVHVGLESSRQRKGGPVSSKFGATTRGQNEGNPCFARVCIQNSNRTA
jgi:hypothetical protein